VKGTPSPPPLLRKSCPQDVVNVLLVEIFPLCMWHRMCCMFQLPKGRWVSGGGCCACCACCGWGRSLAGASRLLSRGWRPGVDFFFQIGINEFCKFITEHLQVGFRIRRAVMLQSIYVHGVKGLERVD
jgi:hypothetical protein